MTHGRQPFNVIGDAVFDAQKRRESANETAQRVMDYLTTEGFSVVSTAIHEEFRRGATRQAEGRS